MLQYDASDKPYIGYMPIYICISVVYTVHVLEHNISYSVRIDMD